MRAFIDFIGKSQGLVKIVVLGAMEELGSASEDEHRLIIEQLKQIQVDQLILVGLPFKQFSESVQCQYFDRMSSAEFKQKIHQTTNAEIFVKGSRKYMLESLFT